MARKNLLAGLLEPTAGASEGTTDNRPRSTDLIGAGAGHVRSTVPLDAMKGQLAHLKNNTVVELGPEQIDPSFVSDRLIGDEADQTALTELIREHGQQVPILVRPHPENQGRYQVVYGHRRLRAALALGRDVRAVVKPLSDLELVVAQGQENSARADLTYIERALFAAALEQRGFDRSTIMAALSVDKFGLSKLIGSVAKIPRDVIEAVGPAARAGRDKWQTIAGAFESWPEALKTARALAATWPASGKTSDERFQDLAKALGRRVEPRGEGEAPTFTAPSGRQVAVLREATGFSNVRIDKRASPGFGAFVFDRLPELYAAYEKARES